jgi:hypothetical protein
MTIDGARFLVSSGGDSSLAGAVAVRGNETWVFMAESPTIGSEAKHALLTQVLATFRFPGPDFIRPTPVPTASP